MPDGFSFQDLTAETSKATDDEPKRALDAYSRNRAWTKAGSRNFYTDLSDADETKFQTWVKANKVPVDDSPHADYDMRGFWKALEAKDPKAISAVDPNDKRLHYPDYWKTPYHETFSAESKWADQAKAPKWNDKDQLVAQDGKVLFDDRAQNKAVEPEGFTFDTLKPAQKKPDRIGEMLSDYEQGAHDLAKGLSTFGGRLKEDLTTGYADKPGYTYGSALPFRKNDETGEIEWGYAPESARQILQAAQMDPLKFDINDPEQRKKVTQVALATAGLNRGPGMMVEPPAAGLRPRTEPTAPGGPTPPALPAPQGTSLAEGGITPTPEPTPGAAPAAPKPGSTPLAEAGITPTPEPTAPVPAAETETVAVPQADGTVKQVQVKTGEPPPPGEPPAPTTAEAPPTGPVNPANLRAGFPDLSDEQFEALFQQANREVPRPTTNDPADQQGWMKSVMGVMARLAAPAAAEEQKPTRITSSQVQARDGVGAVEAGKRAAAENAAQEQQKPTDEWAPVAVAPVDQPDQETLIAQAPGIAAETPPVSSETTAAPVNQPKVDAAPAPSPEAPSPESAPAPIEAHGGPWTPTGKQNHLGEDVFENPNGVRAIMDNGVPWTEATKETDKGLVPKNPGNRKRQHLTTDEPWDEPIKKKAETGTRPAPKAEQTIKKPETAEKPKADWSLLGKNGDGQDVYANPQGVHSTLVDGIRTVEAVRLRPTPQGMAMSVPPPAEKDPQFQVVTPTSESVSESGQIRPENGSLSAEAHPDSTPPSSDSSTTDEAAKPEAPKSDPVRQGHKDEGHKLADEASGFVPKIAEWLKANGYNDSVATDIARDQKKIRDWADEHGAGESRMLARAVDRMAPLRTQNYAWTEKDMPEIDDWLKRVDDWMDRMDGHNNGETAPAASPTTPTDTDKSPVVAPAEAPKAEEPAEPIEVKETEPAAQAKKRDIWYVDHATPEELIRILGDNWVIARDTPANRKRHSGDAKFISRKDYNVAQAQAIAERADAPKPERPSGWIEPGELLWSKSGRQLSPVPKFNPGGGGQRRVTKKVAEWLVSEAQKEKPPASETRWLLDAINEMDPSNLSNSDADLLRETLFGDQNGPLPVNRRSPKTTE